MSATEKGVGGRKKTPGGFKRVPRNPVRYGNRSAFKLKCAERCREIGIHSDCQAILPQACFSPCPVNGRVRTECRSIFGGREGHVGSIRDIFMAEP